MADNTLLSALQPLNVFVSKLGFVPTIINNKNKKTNYESLFKPIIVQICFLSCVVYTLKDRASLNYSAPDHINMISFWVQMYALITIAVIFITVNCINYKRLPNLLDELENIDKYITNNPNFEIYPSYKKLKRVFQIVILLCGVLHVGTQFLDYFTFIQFEYTDEFWKNLSFAIVSHLPITTICFFVVKFCILCYVVKEKFRMINLHLVCLGEEELKNKDGVCKCINVLYEMITIISIVQINYLESVRLCCDLHSKLCDIIKKLNNLFGFQMLVVTVIAFYMTVIHWYYFLLTKYIQGTDFLSTGQMTACLIGATYSTAMVLSICLICHLTISEVGQSVLLMHKINLQKDPKLKEAVELWSLQMVHNKVHFTACGLFKIDLSLVYAYMGSFTTYLIILIQFKQSNLNTSGHVHEY